jgi:hypothetical protein
MEEAMIVQTIFPEASRLRKYETPILAVAVA